MAIASVGTDQRTDFYDARDSNPATRPCPMCGVENLLPATGCDGCGEKLPGIPKEPPPPTDPVDDKSTRSVLLGLFGVLYHPILIFLSLTMMNALFLFGDATVLVVGVAFLLFPLISSVYVLFGDGPSESYYLGARITYAGGMLWLPGWTILQFMTGGIGMC